MEISLNRLPKGQEIKPEDKPEYNCVLTLTPFTGRQLAPFYEIEILEGRVTGLPDGRTRYELNLSDEKTMLLKKAIFNALYRNQEN